MQRARAVISDEIRDIDEPVDRPQTDRVEAALQPVRRRSVLHPAHEPQRKGGAERGGRAEIELDRDGARKLALHRLDGGVLERAHVGCGEVARDALHACAVRPVRREPDLDDGIVELRPFGIARADRRVVGQFDDALVVVGDLQLGRRTQHSAAFDAADGADRERHVLAGDERPGRGEHALYAGARIGGPAHDLHRCARAGIDHAYAQPVGVRVLLGRDHVRDGEGRERLPLVLDGLHFEADHGELVDELVQRRVGVEMLFQPGEGEFHRMYRLWTAFEEDRSRHNAPVF